MSEWIVTSSVLVTVMLGLRCLFRGKISRRLQYALWGLVLLRLLLPFSLFGSSFSVMNIVPDGSPGARQVYVLPVSRQPAGAAPGVFIDNIGTVTDTNSFGYAVVSADGATVTRYAGKLSVRDILGLVWLAGGAAVGLWLAAVNLRFGRLLRQTRRSYCAAAGQLPVYVTGHIASPCLFGVLHPAVYLTPKAAVSEAGVGHVLAHELCHYRHGDHLWSLLRGLCLAVWWWNPLVWAAAVCSREDAELACDEAVINAIGAENRLAYGHTLVDMVAVRTVPTGLLYAATTMAAGKQSIKRRLELIVKNPKTVAPALAVVLLVVTVSVGCTFTGPQQSSGRFGSKKDAFSQAQELYGLRNPYIGNIPGDGALLAALGISESIGAYTLELETKAEPYILQLHFTEAVTDAAAVDSTMNKNAMLLLALIDNVSEIQWQYTFRAQGTGENVSFTGSLTAEAATAALGGANIKSYGQSAAMVQNLLDWLDSDDVAAGYELARLGNGEVLRSIAPLSGGGAKLAEDIIMDYLVKSAAWPGVDIKTLAECYRLRASYSDSTSADYYAYRLDGNAVMQRGTDGHYSRIDDGLYEQLVQLAQSSPATVGGTDGPEKVPAAIDRTDLTECISDAILRANANRYRSGDFAAEAHTVLKTVESGDKITVYAMALYQEFGYAGAGFAGTGGSHTPVAITFTNNAAGEYEPVEYWTPQDGSGYAPSIKAKFPADIYADALDTQKYILAHTQVCYAQAVEYGAVDTGAVIDKLLATICDSPTPMSNPGDYINAHRTEYQELLYYGNYTLQYGYAEFLRSGQTDLRSQIMLAALRELLGGEAISFEAGTAQEWFDAFRANAEALRRQNGDAFMAKNLPRTWLLLQKLDKGDQE